ncbi:MAG TPA: ABC transporter substrate binding protein [Dissulfurispiraceae bacterium]|nr:ABC transporter substrate binding protein [Dissulfurispiraceae bacterium]
MMQLFHSIGRTAALVYLASAVVAGTACTICSAAPAEIVVVQGADIKPFDDALEGFESTCECTISEVIISGSETSDIAGRARRLHPDAVLALGADALAKVRTIRDIPIFYTMTAGARHPFGELSNLSGVSMFISAERQIDAIRELFPGARRIGIIYDARNTAALIERTIQYGRSNSVEVVAKQTSSARDVQSLLEGMKGQIDVLMMVPDVTVTTPETLDSMLLFSFRNRVPIFTFSEKYVQQGAVAALIVAPYDLGAQTGEIARKLMREKAERTAVRSYAKKQVLMINTRIAKKLGIVISDAIMKKSVKVK